MPLHTEELQFYNSSSIILTHNMNQLPIDKLRAFIRECYRYLVVLEPEFDMRGPVDMFLGSAMYPKVSQS